MQYNPKKVYPLPNVFTTLIYPPSQKQEKPHGPSPWIFKPCVDYIDIIGLLSVIFFSKLLTTFSEVCPVEDKTAFASYVECNFLGKKQNMSKNISIFISIVRQYLDQFYYLIFCFHRMLLDWFLFALCLILLSFFLHFSYLCIILFCSLELSCFGNKTYIN